MKSICLASHNKHKLEELNDILAAYKINDLYCFSLASDYYSEEPAETGTTFQENALIKARNAYLKTNLIALADDSGFCVEALNDAPGVYSSRWSGDEKNYADAIAKISFFLNNNPNKNAKFVCCLCLYYFNPVSQKEEYKFFTGDVFGQITLPPQGNKGFAYDPIFTPNNYKQTFAQMEPAEKNKISHRKVALDKLFAFLQADPFKNNA